MNPNHPDIGLVEEGIDWKLHKNDEFQRCERIKAKLFQDSQISQLMSRIKALSDNKFNESNIKCIPCDSTMYGGYTPSQTVILCQNRLPNEADMKNTLIHELIHVFDFVRGRLDFTNCASIVCSEIRAARLTEDCSPMKELERLKLPIGNFRQRCIERRAILSAQYTPACGTRTRTEEEFRKVSAQCMQDYEPFQHPKNYQI